MKFKFTLYKYEDFKLVDSKVVTITRTCPFIAQDYLYRKYSGEFDFIERLS